jgi:hypothetical protein
MFRAIIISLFFMSVGLVFQNIALADCNGVYELKYEYGRYLARQSSETLSLDFGVQVYGCQRKKVLLSRVFQSAEARASIIPVRLQCTTTIHNGQKVKKVHKAYILCE